MLRVARNVNIQSIFDMMDYTYEYSWRSLSDIIIALKLVLYCKTYYFIFNFLYLIEY